MDTTELRKRNLVWIINRFNRVHLPDEIAMQILTLGVFDVECLMYKLNPAKEEKWHKVPASDICGIPITKSKLESLGFFEAEDEEWYHADESLFGISLNKSLPGIKTVVNLHVWDAAFTHAPVDYVHQVQNLFYALTGKELEYNGN